MHLMGVLVGLVFSAVILMLDKGLFAEGKQLMIVVATRIIVITLLAFITSYVFGIAIADDTLKEEIRSAKTDKEKDFSDKMFELEQAYNVAIDDINERMLVDLKKDPRNADDIRSVYEKMKEDKQKARNAKQSETSRRYNITSLSLIHI